MDCPYFLASLPKRSSPIYAILVEFGYGFIDFFFIVVEGFSIGFISSLDGNMHLLELWPNTNIFFTIKKKILTKI